MFVLHSFFFKDDLNNLTEHEKSNFLLVAFNRSLLIVQNMTTRINNSTERNTPGYDEEKMCNFTSINVSKTIL